MNLYTMATTELKRGNKLIMCPQMNKSWKLIHVRGSEFLNEKKKKKHHKSNPNHSV